MTVTFMEQRLLDPKLMTCPHCQKSDRIGIHSRKERRDKAIAVVIPLHRQQAQCSLVCMILSGWLCLSERCLPMAVLLWRLWRPFVSMSAP